MEFGIGLEAEAPVISWVAKDDATARALGSKLIEASSNERASNSFPFAVWHYRYRPKAEPAVTPSIDEDRRKGHVAYDPVAFRCDKGNRQMSRRAKGLYDPSFVAAAVLGPAKRSGYDRGDRVLIRWNLGPDCHPMRMPVHPSDSNGWESRPQRHWLSNSR